MKSSKNFQKKLKKICLSKNKIVNLWSKIIYMGEKIAFEKEFKHDKGKIYVGSMNKKEGKTMYIKLSTYITPTDSLFDCVDKIKRRFKANMYRIAQTYFEEEFKTYLLSVEFNQTKVHDKPGKRSYIAVEVTLFAKNRFNIDKDLIFAANNFGDTLFSLLETFTEDFDINPSKK